VYTWTRVQVLISPSFSVIRVTLRVTHSSKFILAPFLVQGRISHRQFLSRLGKTRPFIIEPLLGYVENANYSVEQYLQGNGSLIQTCSINGLGMYNCLTNQHIKRTCTQHLYVKCVTLPACAAYLWHSDVIFGSLMVPHWCKPIKS
jgi:hypothetical protein